MLDTGRNPIQYAPGRYLRPVKHQVATFRNEDPVPVPELAVPVALPNKAYQLLSGPTSTEKDNALGDLVLIGFYYLLRVGEYTTKKKKERRRTQQFCLGNVRLWRNNKLISHDAPWEILMQAESATLKLDNKKHGIRGALIHHTAVSGDMCPVKALARHFI